MTLLLLRLRLAFLKSAVIEPVDLFYVLISNSIQLLSVKMPLMHLNTNLKDKDIPEDFELELCKKMGEVLNKPIERITLTMHTGVRQMRGGSADPMVSLDIHSIGVFDKERNPTYTLPLLEFLSKKLNLPEQRVLVCCHDLQPHNVGQKLS